jgi:hypothetical protein
MSSMTKSAKGKVVLYVEVPPKVKQEMERLAERHNRRLAGEVTTALQEYIARHHAADEVAKGGK